jgi:ankyrin repeat protein
MFITDTPLKLATQYGHIDAMKLLISEGANLHTKYLVRQNPLIYIAARYEQESALQLLINTCGMDIDEVDMYGSTSLHNMAFSNHTSAMILLLDNGAFINARDTYNDYTPIQWAIECGHIEATQLLIDRGAYIGNICPGCDPVFVMRNIKPIKRLLQQAGIIMRCYNSNHLS